MVLIKRLLLALCLLLPTPAFAAFELADIACETTTTTGTGTINLAGAVPNYQTLVSQVASGNTVPYQIRSGDGKLETGIGTFTDAAPDTLTRVANWSSDGAGVELTLTGTSGVCISPIEQVWTAGVGVFDFDTLSLTTLNDVTTINAATESTIEAAIDTLANLTSIQSLAVGYADAGADAVWGWDDSAATYENLTGAEVAAAIGDNIALTTNTTGNYVASVADGTGIDGTASGEGATYTPTFDATEISSATWGAGSFTTFTFDAGATDPLVTFGSGTITWEGITSFRRADADNAGGQIRLLEDPGTGSNFIGFAAPASITSDVTCTLENDGNPIPDSCVGDGTDAGGGGVTASGTPADNQVAVWTGASTIEGDSAFTFDTASDALSVGTSGVFTTGTIELGAASDTTLARGAAGQVTAEGLDIWTETVLASCSAANPGNGIDTFCYRVSGNSGGGIGLIDGTFDGGIWTSTTTLSRIVLGTGTSGGAATEIAAISGTGLEIGSTCCDTTITRSAAGRIAVEGTVVEQAGTQMLYIPAAAMTGKVTSGADCSVAYDTGTQDNTIRVCGFDTAADESAQFTISMPPRWNEGTITAEFVWTSNAGTATQTVSIDIACVAVSNDDTLNVAMGTAQNVTDTLLAQHDAHLTSATSAMTCAGTPAANDTVIFQITRKTASDTLGDDLKLIGARLFVTTDAANDS